LYLSKRLSSEIIEGSGYRTGLFPFQSLACKQLPTAVATPAAKNERREYDELLMDGNIPEHGPERQNHLPTAYPVSRTMVPAPLQATTCTLLPAPLTRAPHRGSCTGMGAKANPRESGRVFGKVPALTRRFLE